MGWKLLYKVEESEENIRFGIKKCVDAKKSRHWILNYEEMLFYNFYIYVHWLVWYLKIQYY